MQKSQWNPNKMQFVNGRTMKSNAFWNFRFWFRIETIFCLLIYFGKQTIEKWNINYENAED